MSEPRATSTLLTSSPQATADDATVETPPGWFTFENPAVKLEERGGRVLITSLTLPPKVRVSPAQVTRIGRLLGQINSLLVSGREIRPSPIVGKRVAEYLAFATAFAEPAPSVFPLADGGFLIRWVRVDESLDIEFDVEGDVVALLTRGEDRRAGFLHQMWRELARWLFEVPMAA